MMKPEGSQIEKSLFERSAGLLEALGLCRASEILEVRPLAGGVASDIAAVRFGARTVCVKFALPKLRVAADWYAPVSRGRSEFNWLLVARAIVPEATPELFGWSDEHGGFAMEFLSGPDVHVWKAAGLAAALAVRGNTALRDVNIQNLQDLLTSQGAYIGEGVPQRWLDRADG